MKEVVAFIDTHHLDWFYDIGGCETCGPEYEWNCSCGVSGRDAYTFREHQRDAAEKWTGKDGADITKERDDAYIG